MARFNTFMGCTALVLVSSTQIAMADITPSDVWEDWRDYMRGMGYGLTATEALSGDTLTVSDLVFDLSPDADQGEMTIAMGTITLSQNDDGTVSVQMPASTPMVVDITPNDVDAEPVRLALTVNQTGQTMTVSGAPTAMTSSFAAQQIGISVDEITIDDETLDAENAMLNVTLADVESTTQTTLGNLRAFDQSTTIASMTYDMRFKDPDEPAIATIAAATSDMALQTTGVLPRGMAQVADLGAMLQAGMDVSGTLTGGNSTLTLTIEDPVNDNFSAAFASQSSTLKGETSADGISYAGTRQGTTVSVQPQGFPFLLTFGLDNAAFNLSLPAVASDTPQDFALGLNLSDFTMSDMVWGMINPQGTLPRDPASVSFDVTGRATVLADYLKPNIASQTEGGSPIPAQIESATLNSLIVDALGARLTGNGAATFDNSGDNTDLAILQPAGAIDLKLVGGNTLLDKLVESGLLPAQMMMGARMMMGMFAVPGEGEDTLESKLEFTRSGAILANGQRIK